MKVTTTKGSVTNLKIFKPVQYLVVQGTSVDGFLNIKIRARIVNSETGRVDEIIPSISLYTLGEICSLNEGFSIFNAMDGKFRVNVMLHPTSSIYLSNNRYLEVDIIDCPSADTFSLFGLETNVVDKDFVCRYNKFYMSAGELQKTFSVGENENLIIPVTSFSEVTLQYKSGTSCSYTNDELDALMNLKNDIVYVYDKICCLADGNSGADFNVHFGNVMCYALDVTDVSDFTIKRNTAQTAFEIIMIDGIKE